ncbi:aldose epimerase family protein [Paraclostridium bifermentans]|uniref:aldose epimerase family protein n=1 Tax=Paraclostridium bifermentans TaxID=1490 RepID=UPI0025B0CDE2|nr:aldose epimerase family protein [Paraclostridium bifermentans]
MKYSKKIVGKIDNEDIVAHNILYENGFEFEILNLGGIITKIITPDKDHNLENIVVGYNSIDSYKENHSYMGAIIGRTSGRINEGIIKVENKEYKLFKNYGKNQGHGGKNGFNKKIYEVESAKEGNNITLKLKAFSKDMEESYPGNLEIEVSFKLSENFHIKQIYKAYTDKTTLVNMTNHTYFNLSGNLKESITKQYMKVDSNYILELDEDCIPTGKYINVDKTPFDFRILKCIGKDIDDKKDKQIKIGCGYDHVFMFDKGYIHLEDKVSKRAMDITTNQHCVVIYSMNFIDELTLYNNKLKQRRYGICFETQEPPIGHNMCFLENSILNKGSIYNQVTEYKFYNIND